MNLILVSPLVRKAHIIKVMMEEVQKTKVQGGLEYQARSVKRSHWLIRRVKGRCLSERITNIIVVLIIVLDRKYNVNLCIFQDLLRRVKNFKIL